MNERRLRDIEGDIRRASTRLWESTVDNPETATFESEAAGMTPERLKIRQIYRQLDVVADEIDRFIQDQL